MLNSYKKLDIPTSDKAGKESQYLVSHPELSSDPSIGLDRESGCDSVCEYV